MSDCETWTIVGLRAETEHGDAAWIENGRIVAERVPLDVVAALLRAAGYKVVSPKAQSELGR